MRKEIEKIINHYIAHESECAAMMFEIGVDELMQLMCDKAYTLLLAKYHSVYSPEMFVELIFPNAKLESIASGFTEQQIINSLNKIKNS